MVKKGLAGFVSIAVALQCMALTALADTTVVSYDSSVDENASGYYDVSVDAEKAEVYTVTLPKAVTMEVTDNTAAYEYSVIVQGDISTNHYVRVIPLADAQLVNEDETLVLPLSVTQAKKRWTSDEVITGTASNTTTGTFTATDVEPGKYTGNVRYLVTLDDGGLWKAATCTAPAIRVGVDADDSGVIEDAEKDTEVITKGKALGHKFEDGCTDFPATCTRCNKLVYAISTPEQFVAFAEDVNSGNSYEGATIELNADIDMSSVTMPVIGSTNSKPFKGSFNGNGYTVSNYTVDTVRSSGGGYVFAGMFGAVDGNSIIQNFVLINPVIQLEDNSRTVSAAAYVAFIVGGNATYNQSYFDPDTAKAVTIQDVQVRNGSVIVSTTDDFNGNDIYIGGIASFVRGNIKNCSVTGSLVTTDTDADVVYIGGIVNAGQTLSSDMRELNIQNCFVSIQAAVANSATCTIDAVASMPTYVTAISNVVYDSTKCTSTCTDATGLSTDDCKTQTAVDVLNTDNTGVWSMDLESINEGYPIIK